MKHTGFRVNPGRGHLPPLWATVANVASMVDLDPLAPEEIMDQGTTGSCVGHARALQIMVARAVARNPLPWTPSPRYLYSIARCYERGEWTAALQDLGCDPVDTIKGAALWGVAPMVRLPERYSDADPATINEPPDLDVILDGIRLAGQVDGLIVGTPAERVRAAQEALTRGEPVCIDVAGGSPAWQGYTGGVLQDQGYGTDHYVTILGYRVPNGGPVVFTGRNSWGQGWGREGRFECDASVITASRVPIASTYVGGF